jgi:glucose/mannose transport system substrate-binding protein
LPLGRLVVAALGLAAPACAEPPSSTTNQIEMLDWWTEEGERAALAKLLEVFASRYPDQTVSPSPIQGSDKARETIMMRMVGGQPPDTFQANGGWDLLAWVLYNRIDDMQSKMENIDDLVAQEGWAVAIPDAVLNTVSVGQHTYAVPLNIHRLNTLFYNKRIFDDNGVDPQSLATLDDLFALAETLKGKGITPFALGMGPDDHWTLALLLFENILVARGGGAYYQQFFRGRGHALDDPAIRQSVSDLARLLGSYRNSDAGSLTWGQAVDLVRTGDAAMTIMGDWAKASLQANGAQPDVDFGAIPTPGTRGTFVFTTDTFGLPRGARNREGARDLLRVFGSTEGQDAFNPVKGSISARRDADMSRYDPMAKATISDFRDASPDSSRLVPATAILAPQEFMDQLNETLATFAADGNASVVIHTLANWNDLLSSRLWPE